MLSLLLVLIYIAFISLGLPDSLLGSAWPVMQPDMDVPLSYAGIVSLIIAGGTVVSSLLSDRITRRFGTALVTAVSVLMTAAALFGFSVSGSFWMLCLCAIPYGLGAGGVDAALNGYVALHYSSRHMNWLHCFWGVGASIGPYIMGFCLTRGLGWTGGYRTIGIIQVVLTGFLFISIPLWKRRNDIQQNGDDDTQSHAPVLKLPQILRIRGAKFVLIAFFGYCALESTTGLWASSYLVLERGINPETAATYASLFFLGITAGRFISGFISDKLGDRKMIFIGIALMLAGITAVWLPVTADWVSLNGLILIGLGCAPVYPAIIHSTPYNFGAENAQAIIGVQMASAYIGSALMPPLFGLIADHIDVGLYPVFLLVMAALIFVMIRALNRAVDSKKTL